MTKQALVDFGVWRKGAYGQGVVLEIGGVQRATAPGDLWRSRQLGASKPQLPTPCSHQHPSQAVNFTCVDSITLHVTNEQYLLSRSPSVDSQRV
jgi:hypothetical protein